jgi:hypothetical protein
VLIDGEFVLSKDYSFKVSKTSMFPSTFCHHCLLVLITVLSTYLLYILCVEMSVPFTLQSTQECGYLIPKAQNSNLDFRPFRPFYTIQQND